MMALQLPPSSNWSQLESERFFFPQDFDLSIADYFPALYCASFVPVPFRTQIETTFRFHWVQRSSCFISRQHPWDNSLE
jgi:hypothetical protein